MTSGSGSTGKGRNVAKRRLSSPLCCLISVRSGSSHAAHGGAGANRNDGTTQQIGKQRAIDRPGDVLLQDELQRVAERRITAGLGEHDGADDDDLAAGIGFARTKGLTRFIELAAGFELVCGRQRLRQRHAGTGTGCRHNIQEIIA